MKLNGKTAAAAVVASMLAGGAIGIALFGPSLAGAQTTTTNPPATGNAPESGAFHSNEDATHEATESPQREADEDAGRGFRGHGGGSNEDPTHEASESPEREAEEDARKAPAPSTATPTTTAPTAQNSSF